MNVLYKFTDNNGSFIFPKADKIRSLYFPLCNKKILSSITPYLCGDIKSGQDAFLMPPVSRIDLINSKVSRNFWIYIDKDKLWSATGVSKDLKAIKEDKFTLEAGLLWHKITRENKRIGLRSEILSFIPSSGEPVELMQVTITNISPKKISFIPTAAIPMYARGANNIRDHRHVTSLLQRIILHKFGIISKPTLSFDESGHKPNKNYYFILGWDEKGNAPQYLYPTQEIFCGESGDLEAPESILENSPLGKEKIQGKEPMGALRFRSIKLASGRFFSYIIVMGITQEKSDISGVIKKFKNLKRIKVSLEETKRFWLKQANAVSVSSRNEDFKNWFRWVSIQPVLRKIFGCSFLPDFDYGKGGRGWRDLWQDCLGLILSGSKEVRSILINNLSGVRPDGSNATIIGKKPGEFVADRNDISRVWMDHGIWPLIAIELYINKAHDAEILFERTGYFIDQHIFRSRKINRNLKPCKYKGTVLEHLILQNLTQFFNVGTHNHIRLEGADWNDGLDMAGENGESVTFSAMYAGNLKKLAQLLRRSGRKKIKLFSAMKLLLKPCNYNNIKAKQEILEAYFTAVESGISGRAISFDCVLLIRDLEEKARWMTEYIRRKEWLDQGFFNGYYDNQKRRVEGKVNGKIRMMLASQVFAIMSGVTTDAQIKKIIASVEKYLFDKKLGGYRLNTDFGREEHNLGRAFSFIYGDKENGAIFSHMVVMYAYALFIRGFRKEAQAALESLYRLSVNSPKSKIYPCLTEYFNAEGRGMYSYLTGSASWFVLASAV
ncbi:MAG: cellobiose phosphorylase [Candidatus Omnitrophica bacterium]|nr:cellobiose phosphorylase [Candidatus Omnitrophota bacterium]